MYIRSRFLSFYGEKWKPKTHEKKKTKTSFHFSASCTRFISWNDFMMKFCFNLNRIEGKLFISNESYTNTLVENYFNQWKYKVRNWKAPFFHFLQKRGAYRKKKTRAHSLKRKTEISLQSSQNQTLIVSNEPPSQQSRFIFSKHTKAINFQSICKYRNSDSTFRVERRLFIQCHFLRISKIIRKNGGGASKIAINLFKNKSSSVCYINKMGKTRVGKWSKLGTIIFNHRIMHLQFVLFRSFVRSYQKPYSKHKMSVNNEQSGWVARDWR